MKDAWDDDQEIIWNPKRMQWLALILIAIALIAAFVLWYAMASEPVELDIPSSVKQLISSNYKTKHISTPHPTPTPLTTVPSELANMNDFTISESAITAIESSPSNKTLTITCGDNGEASLNFESQEVKYTGGCKPTEAAKMLYKYIISASRVPCQ